MKILLQINDNVLMTALILVLLNEMEEKNINQHQMASTNCDIIFILHTGCSKSI